MNTKYQKTLFVQFWRISSIFMILSMLVSSIGVNPVSAAPTYAWLSGWANKIPVTISNSGVALTDYQVQINLDASNFDFNQANSDGSDIRFTAADGSTLLSFWMETWNPGISSTIWVKIPALPAGGNVTIYMYSGNFSATSTSNGSATFYFFENFESEPWTAWTKEVSGIGTFIQSTEQAKRGSRSGKFEQLDGASSSTVFTKTSSLPGTDFVQEWDFYDDLDSTAFKMVRANYNPGAVSGGQIGIGVWTGASAANYSYHNTSYVYTPSSVGRTSGWHKMAIRVTSGNANFFVDGSSVLETLTGLPTTFNRVSVEGIPDGPTAYYVDDFRVRKYASIAPTVAIGQGGQPAVDLAINLTDSPDPLKIDEQLTYQIAVNNYGDLDATNVSVSDTLPANVNFVSAISNPGSCSGTSIITCNLGSIASGGSATVTIIVTTTTLGQLSNTATVSSNETDPNLANNTSTTTSSVGDPVVYVVAAIDTEPFDNHVMTPQNRPFVLSNFIKGTSTYIGPLMNSTFRNANKDSFGTPFKMTWYMEMDNYINNGVYADGSSMNYLTLYNTFVDNFGTEITTWGDELANHHHFMTWNGSSWVQLTDGSLLDSSYDEHNNALDRMVLDANFFPTSYRSGWLWESNQLQAWVEKWMLSDFSGPFGGNPTYFTYHPLASNYTQVDTTNNIKHWLSGCDGGPNSTNINAAFAQAKSTAKPVIYCWYGHDRENMSGYISSLQPMLDSASSSNNVPFKYATAKEAMQAVMGTNDTTPPTLNVAKGSGDTFNITSNEAVWNNAPYVTARYLMPNGLKYIHTPATSSGTNTWTAQVADQQIWTTSLPGEKYPLVGVTASSAKAGNPATYATDGNESTYWDSETLPQWIYVDLGSEQTVPMMTVHFYDLDPRTYTYSIDSSTDGTNWSQIVASTTVHGVGTHQFSSPINMRYARVNITAASTGSWAHIFEITLYKTQPTTTNATGYLQQVGVGAGDLAGNTAVASTIIRPLADLALTKSATPPSGRLGSNLTYNLTVTNHGPSPATDIQVTDNLPAGLTFVSAGSGCTYSDLVVTCNLSDLANGASATVSIVVTPTAEGTYINIASVTAASTDSNQADNTASLSTVVGNPVVYVVAAIDTEPFDNHNMTPQNRPFVLSNFIKGTSTYIGPLMNSTFRNANKDSFGTPFKMTWYMEMDNYINNGVYADGSSMNYLTLYNTFVDNFGTEITTWGDELANHHHFMTWNGSSWVQLTDGSLLDSSYDEHNNALDRMVLDASFFPTSYRSGWLWESNQLQAWVEKWMLSDFSGPFGGNPSYSTYHPSPTDFTQAGNMNHWVSGCDYGGGGSNINAAFTQAQTTGKPVIYCWYGHDRENMSSYVSSLQPILTGVSSSTGVPFKYATAKEAIQGVMGTTDTIPPVLTVTPGSDSNTFNITSNEPVWNNAPYVAARYAAPSGSLKYIHTAATLAGVVNTWTAQVPATQTWTTTIQPEKYSPASVSATHSDSSYPPSLAIDGNDTTYWDSGNSYGLPQSIQVDLGSIKPVPMLTVHFYDLDGRNYTYSIDASDDGATWRGIVSSRSVTGLATHSFSTPENMRYARVNVTNGSASPIAHIFEITLYKTATTTTVEETGELQQVGVGAGDLSGNTAVAAYLPHPIADLSLTKTSTPTSLRMGSGNLTYNLTVTNHGPSTATGIQVTDNLPAGLTFVSAGSGCTYSSPNVTCDLSDLTNGASATVNIVVTPTAENTYVNTASVSSTSTDSNQANNTASVATVVGNPLVYVVIAIDTEADNNHPMGTLHTTFDVHNYQRVGTSCPSFVAKYSGDAATWSTYADGTSFNFNVTEVGQTDPATSFICGYNNSYGLDDYARAVRFTVPSSGSYNIQLQLSVVGSPPDTHLHVVPDLSGNPDTANPLSTFVAHAPDIISSEYVTIGSNLSLQAGTTYWWVADRQSNGDDSNQFAVYQSSTSASNTFSQIMDPAFRSATIDSNGDSFKMTWYMEIDNFINNGLYADGRPMNYLTLYNELMNNWGTEVSTTYKDEIAYHHHFMYWDGSAWQMGGQEQATSGPYDEHNNALDRMVLDANFFPTNFRAGWLNNDNQLQAWVEKWMLSDDGGVGWATGWDPYHPSTANYTQVGDMAHWIANCPGGPSQGSVDAAFAQAIAENKPVVYCWYMHQRDDMKSLVASANSYLNTASLATGVDFEYVTAKDAMQAVIGTTDKTSPLLSVTPSTGNNYIVTSNETLWGSGPYVAARYGEGTSAVYQHVTATSSGTNTWTVNLPPLNGLLELKQVSAGALDLSGNSAVANYDTNTEPVAVNDTYNTNAGIALNIAAPGVLGNDTDVDLNPLTAIKVSDPAHGILVLNANGSFTYTPASGYTGDDAFTYKANDGSADSNNATVTIHVNSVTPPPILPSSFYGEIHNFDNLPAPGGTVKVFVPDVSVPMATATISLYGTDLAYSLDVPGDISGTLTKEGGAEGDLLTFMIGDRVVATGTWHSGRNVLLNIHPPQAIPGGPYSGNAGVAISFSGSANDWGGSVGSSYQWDWDGNGTYEETGQNPSHTWPDNGNYTVGLKVTDSQGGVGIATVAVTVNKIPVIVTLSNLSQTYNGMPRPAIVTTMPAELGITITYNGESEVPVNAGSYTVVATITDLNYVGEATGTLEIGKASSAVTVICPLTAQAYTGSAIEACTASYSGAGGLTGSLTPTYAGNMNVGTATASATYAGDDNHFGSSNSADFEIGKASSAVTVICPLTAQAYTGSAIEPCTASYSGAGGLTGSLTPTYAGNMNVGTATASASYAGDDNHFGSSNSADFEIGKATSAVTVICPLTAQAYTGSAIEACTASYSGAGGLTGSLTPTYAGNTNVGTATASASYAGDDNHFGSSNSADFEIGKATSAVTVICPLTAQAYTGSAIEACTASYSGAGGLTGSLTPTYAGNMNVGTATASASYAGDDNHFGSSNSADFEIGKASSAVTVICPLTAQAYTGSAIEPCTASYSGAGGLTGSLTPTYAGNMNVGTATASASYAGDDNHFGSSNSADFEIGKATSAVTVICPLTAQAYTGSVIEPCTASYSGAGGLTGSLTPTYAGNTNVGTATASASYAGDDNHFGSSNSADFEIGKATSAVTVICPLTAQAYTGSAIEPCTASYSGAGGLTGSLTPTYAGNTNVGTATASATYAGDDNHFGSSNSADFEIGKASSAVTVICPLTAQAYTGSAIEPCTASYSGAGGLTGSLTPTYAGNMNVGTATASATYAGDDNHFGSSNSADFEIGKASSAVTVICPLTAQAYTGSAIEPCTASYSGAGGLTGSLTPTYAGNMNVGTATASATYAGDDNHFGSSNSADFEIGKASSAVTVICPLTAQAYTGSAIEPCTASYSGAGGLTGSLTPTYAGNMNVGTATASASYAGDDNHFGSSNSADFEIGKASSAVTVICPLTAQAYTGSAIEPCTASYSGAGGLTGSLTPTYAGNMNVGTATASATYAGDDNHFGSSNSADFEIGKASSAVTVICPLTAQAYTGSAIEPCTASYSGAGGLTGSLTPTYAGNMNVGTATASASYAGDDNHFGSSNSADFEIGKASSAVTVICPLTAQAYTGSAIEPCTASYSGAGGLTGSLTPTYAGNTNVGTATASASYAGDDNHFGSSNSADFEIGKASSAVTVICPLTAQAYTGSAIEPCTASYSGAGGLTGSLTPTYAGNTNVGTATASATYAGDDNHFGSSNSADFEIGKASSAVTVICPLTAQAYTGSAIEPCTASYSGAGGLTGSLTPTYAGNMNVGTATASATYAGDDNHFGSSNSADFEIGKASAIVTLIDMTQIYDGTPKSVTVTTSPLGLSVRVTYNGSETQPISDGSYAVVATITNPNYTGTASGTFVILAKHSITLVQGWNLVSFSVHPTNTNIAEVLSSIDGNYNLVYAWNAMRTSDNWMKYAPPPAPPYSNSLDSLDETMGFWIYMTVADTLDVVGTAPSTTSIPLLDNAGGWNLVSYPSVTDRELPAALSTHGVGTNFTLVYAYHANDIGDPWKLFDIAALPFANDLNPITPGWGYWIKVNGDHTWSVKYLAD